MNIKTIISNIWYYRRNRKRNKSFDEINNKLEKALRRKRKDQYKLESELRRYMRKFLKVGANSKFIPLDVKSNHNIKVIVEKKFGTRMAKLDISLNVDTMQLEIR
jgi:hypothetical protein